MVEVSDIVIFQEPEMDYPEIGHIIWIGPDRIKILCNRGIIRIKSSIILQTLKFKYVKDFRYPILPKIEEDESLENFNNYPKIINEWYPHYKMIRRFTLKGKAYVEKKIEEHPELASF
jgi:hypothetical protein